MLFKNTLLILFFLISIQQTFAMFEESRCLALDFEMNVAHSSGPFGLLEKKVCVSKKKCTISIIHNSWKYIDKKWTIDVCREPVHIKYGAGAIDVFKKNGICNVGNDGPFCSSLKSLVDFIQDDGLIFVKGSKEVLTSDHGKLYCAYLLIKAYLERSYIFSPDEALNGVLIEKTTKIDDIKKQNVFSEKKPKKTSAKKNIEILPSDNNNRNNMKHGEF